MNSIKKYKPAFWLRNPHVQNIVNSSLLRRILLRHRYRDFVSCSTELQISGGDGIRLQGEQSIHDDKKRPLLILFHGWEGSSKSGYVISAGGHAFQKGYNVFRLNFRDHNDTHHLNKEIFNSSLIEEVVHAVGEIQNHIPHTSCHIAGFSLGANFALRVGIHANELPQKLDSIVSVCPVIDPDNSTDSIEDAFPIYEFYFTRKWKKSLKKKLEHFPEYGYGDALKRIKKLGEMNEYFIPRFTEYDTLKSYFETYTMTAQKLSAIDIPTLILASADDSMIPIEDIRNVKKALPSDESAIEFDLQEHGAHCAFVRGISRASWADLRLLDFIEGLNR